MTRAIWCNSGGKGAIEGAILSELGDMILQLCFWVVH